MDRDEAELKHRNLAKVVDDSRKNYYKDLCNLDSYNYKLEGQLKMIEDQIYRGEFSSSNATTSTEEQVSSLKNDVIMGQGSLVRCIHYFDQLDGFEMSKE